ncbi:Polynucleotide 5'-hydroxyl-kinase grc3 [Haplosporangium sp. Z 767]|nr:Polynucleotide 5'-hydroxyl-kinase grc3 [Haplosporangium sp. Z 767]
MIPRRSTFLAAGLAISLTCLFIGWHDTLASLHAARQRTQPSSFYNRDLCLAAKGNQTDLRVMNLDYIHRYLPIGNLGQFSPTDHVLIATPLMAAASYLDNYFRKLAEIEYPKQLISLGFLVSTTTTDDGQVDPTLAALQSHVSDLVANSTYRRITIVQQSKGPTGHPHKQRHAYELQESRRKVLARCRNSLLASALVDESWVLWLDVDVIEYSPGLLLDLITYDKDIVAPNCFYIKAGWFTSKYMPYDRNNWMETTESLAHQRVLDEDEILFEGYDHDHPTYRLSMADMDQTSKNLVPLDGVGGTFTLVKASVHRAGVNFPSIPVDHEIETEGLAKWAKREGFGVFGAPHLSSLTMPPKQKKQRTSSSTTISTTISVSLSTTGSAPAPLSALAARRQKLLDKSSKASTPEVEEHVQVDNLDVDEEEKASLVSSTSGDSDDDTTSDQEEEAEFKSSPKGTTATPQNERRERKPSIDIVIQAHAAQCCIFVRPSHSEHDDPWNEERRGHSTVLGYIMSGTAEKRRTKSKKNQVHSGPNELDLSSISTFTIFSPRTHALAVIESVSLAGTQKDLLVQQRTKPTSPETKAQLEALMTQFAFDDYDTVLAIQASDCGIFGIEKVVPIFKGILSIKHTTRLRGTEDEDRQALIRFETSLAGFHPILEPTDSIAALRIPNTWRDAMQALLDSTRGENSGRIKHPPVTVVCGGKKMGKSTFSRLILNRMLNRYRKVAFIECDIGQSEFTPVGMVALHVIETPALGAPFTHPRQPYRAFFVGNSTPRDDPDYYITCIKELVKTYYAEVSHTRSWQDMDDDDYHSDDEEDNHIPLIINTQGWIKGLGYDLLLQLLDYTAPSYVFGFHSPSSGESNLPQTFFTTMQEQALMAGREQPSFSYVAAVALGDESNTSPFTKYHPADHRALALLSYFYLKQAESNEHDSLSNDTPVWDFTRALVVRRPWCWDWSQAKGIWVLFDQVPPSQILHVLNASLVALTGDKEIRDSDDNDDNKTSHLNMDDQQQPASAAMDASSGQVVPPTYFPLGQYPPPPPEHTTCYGLAIIRSIQPLTRTLHILTPLPLSKLKKCNGIVKGAIHMPIHASLDHNEDHTSVPGVAGVPWKKVPYLNYEISSGNYNNGSQSPSGGNQSPRLGFAPAVKIIGADAKVARKNLGRKRLQT